MPLVSKAFGDIITFTRASTGTYFDSAGVLTSANSNIPRFDYNPATLAAQGLLIEEQRTNVLLYSEELNNVLFWIPQQASITANATTSPSNTLTADKLVEDTSTNIHTNYCFPTGPAAGTPFTVSVFAKASERTAFAIDVRASGIGFRSVFDLTAVTATGAVITSGTLVSTSITSVGNGWFRCSVTGSHPSATQYNVTFRLNNPAGTDSYTGDGTSGLFLWGAQLEAGAFPTSYIPTTTMAQTRSEDRASVNTLSPWYNSTQGTLYGEFFVPPNLAGFPGTTASFSDGTTSNQIAPYAFTVGLFTTIRTGGVAQGDPSVLAAPVVGALAKYATAMETNNCVSAWNGTVGVVDTSVALPTVNQLRLGVNGAGVGWSNTWLRRLTYYPRRLSSAELQSLTA